MAKKAKRPAATSESKAARRARPPDLGEAFREAPCAKKRPKARGQESSPRGRPCAPAAGKAPAGESRAQRRPIARRPGTWTARGERSTTTRAVRPPRSTWIRRGTSARTGRAEMAESMREHQGMSPAITGGDVDVDVEDAYFSGDEAPGGDNPTPDQDVVDDIGQALGVEYQDNEELKAADKVDRARQASLGARSRSSEDYRERK